MIPLLRFSTQQSVRRLLQVVKHHLLTQRDQTLLADGKRAAYVEAGAHHRAAWHHAPETPRSVPPDLETQVEAKAKREARRRWQKTLSR